MNPNFVIILQGGVEVAVSKKEADFYLQEINKGKKMIIIRDHVLSPAMIAIVPEEKWLLKEEWKEKTKSGQWRCDYGSWHDKNQGCMHHLVDRGHSGFNEFVGIKTDLLERIGGQLKPLQTENNLELKEKSASEEKLNKLEAAEGQGKDIDWERGEVLD